jgi:hypothetical protein
MLARLEAILRYGAQFEDTDNLLRINQDRLGWFANSPLQLGDCFKTTIRERLIGRFSQ